jgi:hypothetical protein
MVSDVNARPNLHSSRDFPPLQASKQSPLVPIAPPCLNDETIATSCNPKVSSALNNYLGSPSCELGQQVLGVLEVERDVGSGSELVVGVGISSVETVVQDCCTSSVCINDARGSGHVTANFLSSPSCVGTPVLPSVADSPGLPSATPIASDTQSVRHFVSADVNPGHISLNPGGNMKSPNVALDPIPVATSGVECSHSQSVPKSWSSLFTSMPRNAGVYEPVVFEIHEENGVKIHPPNVIQAGVDFWSEYVVGFFLDPKHRLPDVAAVCRRAWRLHGGLKVKLVDSLYYLLFSSPEERSRVLESEPTFFDGQPFIITPWSPTIASVREQVFSIPVWVYFSQIPSALQPLLGLNWLACNVGKLKCFDSSTVARDKLVYAKALIEISPLKPLPTSIPVQLAVGHVADVRVRYGWVPDICSSCHSFGHIASACSRSVISASAPKIPLPRPPLRKWVPKVTQDASLSTDPNPPISLARPASPVPSAVLPTSKQDRVGWADSEHCWVDLRSDMRFNPEDDTYLRYVSDDLLDLRCLYYTVSGDSLVLDLDGSHALINSVLLADSAWDRSFIYSSDVDSYDPSLAVLFRPFFGLLPGGSLVSTRVDVGVCDSSSAEEN